MSRKEIILVCVVIAIAFVATFSLIALTPKKTSSDTDMNNMNGMDMSDHSNMSGGNSKSDGTKAPQVDLTDQTTVAIDIKDFAYSQPNIKIRKGTTVTWTNRDSTQHNAMKAHDGSGMVHDAPTKDEVKPDEFAGPLLKQGESYSFTFNEVGTDPYHCAPHPYMKGIVTVVE